MKLFDIISIMKAFAQDKYIKIQREQIEKRIDMFKGKLYLEFGGKIFDDHAQRVLPGFAKDSKLQMLMSFKDKVEIIIVLNAKDIIENKMRSSGNITYIDETIRLINSFYKYNLSLCAVVISFYTKNKQVTAFEKRLKLKNIKVYKQYNIEGYPEDIEKIFSDQGFGKNDYIETTKPLVVVTAPGAGSGKFACCLSQLYLEKEKGVHAGYAKYELFPVWNLDLNHPVNLAYEAATVDLSDRNMIDKYHKEAYGVTTVNYNRDIEAFPILKESFEKIFGKSPYNSPTDMGVNMAGFAIEDDEYVRNAANEEIIRRYFKAKKNYSLGLYSEETLEEAKKVLEKAGLSIEDRASYKAAIAYESEKHLPTFALELPTGVVIKGKRSPLLSEASACLINALKYLSNIKDSVDLLSREVVDILIRVKVQELSYSNPKLKVSEVLTALAILEKKDANCKNALSKLSLLRGAEAHSCAFMFQDELSTLNRLGINVTESDTATEFKTDIL